MGEIALPGPRSDRRQVYHVLATTVRDEQDAVRNVVAVLRDITSRKEVGGDEVQLPLGRFP